MVLQLSSVAVVTMVTMVIILVVLFYTRDRSPVAPSAPVMASHPVVSPLPSTPRRPPTPASTAISIAFPQLYSQSCSTVVSITSFFGTCVDDTYATTILGSGFFVDVSGFICTASHNVYRTFYKADGTIETKTATEIIVSVTDSTQRMQNKRYPAKVVGIDGKGNMAIIKIKLTYRALVLPLMTSAGIVSIGAPVLMIGDPYGMDSVACSTGVVRDDHWTDPTNSYMLTSVLTDIQTSPGNSGSPILAGDGTIVSMHTGTVNPKNTFGGGPTAAHIQKFVTFVLSSHMDSSEDAEFISIPKKQIKGTEFVANSAHSINQLRKSLSVYKKQLDKITETTVDPVDLGRIQDTIDPAVNDSLTIQTILATNASIHTDLPDDYTWVDVDGFLLTNVPKNHHCLELGDVVTHINNIPIGTDHRSHAMGDILWYLADDSVELTVVRRRGKTNARTTTHESTTVVSMSPTLDVSSRAGSQGYGDSIGSVTLALTGVAATVVAGGTFGISVVIAAYGLVYLKTMKDLGKRHGLNVDFLFWL
jgi:S1-C subfamily serine protease